MMHEYLVRNGMRIPLKKSTICTGDYLTEVCEKKCFAFPHKDIKLPCKVLKPPPLRILTLMLAEAFQDSITSKHCPPEMVPSVKRLREHLQYRMPDRDFCLDYLGTLHVTGIE